MAKLIRPKVKKTEGAGNPGVQTFDFRLRFNMLKGDHIDSESEEIQLMLTPNGQLIRLRAGPRGSPIKSSSEIAILGGPYPLPEDAEKAGGNIRQAVLIWALGQRLGLDFGDGILRSFITDHGKKVYERKFGRPV